MAWTQVPLYVVAQLVGAIARCARAVRLLHGFEGFDSDGNMGQNAFGDIGTGYAWWAAFLLELVMTAVFVWVILAVTDERNEHPAFAPLAIGLTLAAIHFVAIPATGTSVNPARSIGPALFAGGDAILQLWLFIVAPLVGAAIAGLTYPLLFGHASEPVPGSGLNFSRGGAAAVPGYGAPDQFQQEWNQQDPQDPYAAYRAQGWEWDAAAQEWRHESQRPAAPAQQAWQQPEQGQQAWQPEQAQQAWQPEQQAPQPNAQPGAEQQWQQPEPQQWPGTDQGESRTQIRPPEGQ